jgi:hypothetical protein
MRPPVEYGEWIPVPDVDALRGMDVARWGGIVVRPSPTGQRQCEVVIPRQNMGCAQYPTPLGAGRDALVYCLLASCLFYQPMAYAGRCGSAPAASTPVSGSRCVTIAPMPHAPMRTISCPRAVNCRATASGRRSSRCKRPGEYERG